MTDIKNLTPARFRCTYTISCPSVHRLEDGRLLIVGADGPSFVNGELIVDEGESAIIIHPDLLSTVMQEEIEKATDPLLRENWQLKQALGYPIPAAFDTPQNPFKCGTCTARWNSFPSEIEKAVKAERERCAKIAYQIAEEADHGGKETPAGRQARKIGNAIRFSLAEGGEE